MYFQISKSANLFSFCKQVKSNKIQIRKLTPIVAPPAGNYSTGQTILMYGGIILSCMAPTIFGLYSIPSWANANQAVPEPAPEEPQEAAYIRRK